MQEENKKTVAVSGMNGQIGRELAALAPRYPSLRFLFLSRQAFPLDDAGRMDDWFRGNKADAFINCAADTAVHDLPDPAELADIALTQISHIAA